MSDWERISDALADRFTFRNTFLHADPKFDVLHPTPEDIAAYDFVISSEVFEHIPPPIQVAFDNLSRVLRPSGFVVFTVPWKPEGSTEERFPTLYDWRIEEQLSGVPVLVNRTAKGEVEQMTNLVFHGGGGQTLEMRLFSKPDLIAGFTRAGFKSITFSKVDEHPAFGIVWEGHYSLGLIARKKPGVFALLTYWLYRQPLRVLKPHRWKSKLRRGMGKLRRFFL